MHEYGLGRSGERERERGLYGQKQCALFRVLSADSENSTKRIGTLAIVSPKGGKGA